MDRVYCLVRADSDEAADLRISESLRAARLEVSDHETRLRIVALASDLGQPRLGLNVQQYDALRNSVTDIIHGAWAVNFNMALSSFENPCIASVSHLLDLAICSPSLRKPSFSFISSLATVLYVMDQGGAKEVRYGLEVTTPMGYGQSKWVAEEICSAAAKHAAQQGVEFTVQILRVGQVVGDTKHGIWNPKEAIPLTVQTALTTGALPVREGTGDLNYWLPVDIAATAIVELAFRSRSDDEGKEARVFHVLNTVPLSWNTEFLPALASNNLSFDAVPSQEWLRRLESAVPNHRLLQFFKRVYGGVRDKQGSKRAEGPVDISEARKCSGALRRAKKIDEELVGKFLSYWLGLEAWRSIRKTGPADDQARVPRRDSGVGVGKM